MCFMLVTIHILALTILTCSNPFQEVIDYLIEEAKRCLAGEHNITEAKTTSLNLWTYSKSRWPEYERNINTSNQADAAEYLIRIINESNNIKQQVGTRIQTRSSCKNKHCPSRCQSQRHI